MAAHSVYSTNSRYSSGGKTETTEKFLGFWDRVTFPEDSSDGIYTLEKIYQNRPDLLAFAVYGDSSLFWIILQYNNIIDPFTEFKEGIVLKIPTKDRVLSDFLGDA